MIELTVEQVNTIIEKSILDGYTFVTDEYLEYNEKTKSHIFRKIYFKDGTYYSIQMWDNGEKFGECDNILDCIGKDFVQKHHQINWNALDNPSFKVIFQKKDGHFRMMLATKKLEHVPSQYHPTHEVKRPKFVECVFDLINNGWRTFDKDNVIILQ